MCEDPIGIIMRKKVIREYASAQEIARALMKGEPMPCTTSLSQKIEYVAKTRGTIFGTQNKSKIRPLDKII